jgi:hypothetical protein
MCIVPLSHDSPLYHWMHKQQNETPETVQSGPVITFAEAKSCEALFSYKPVQEKDTHILTSSTSKKTEIRQARAQLTTGLVPRYVRWQDHERAGTNCAVHQLLGH